MPCLYGPCCAPLKAPQELCNAFASSLQARATSCDDPLSGLGPPGLGGLTHVPSSSTGRAAPSIAPPLGLSGGPLFTDVMAASVPALSSIGSPSIVVVLPVAAADPYPDAPAGRFAASHTAPSPSPAILACLGTGVLPLPSPSGIAPEPLPPQGHCHSLGWWPPCGSAWGWRQRPCCCSSVAWLSSFGSRAVLCSSGHLVSCSPFAQLA